jgi:hypothetical protein
MTGCSRCAAEARTKTGRRQRRAADSFVCAEPWGPQGCGCCWDGDRMCDRDTAWEEETPAGTRVASADGPTRWEKNLAMALLRGHLDACAAMVTDGGRHALRLLHVACDLQEQPFCNRLPFSTRRPPSRPSPRCQDGDKPAGGTLPPPPTKMTRASSLVAATWFSSRRAQNPCVGSRRGPLDFGLGGACYVRSDISRCHGARIEESDGRGNGADRPRAGNRSDG